MSEFRQVLDEYEQIFNLGVIKNLPLPEKFKLVDYIRHIYREAIYAQKHGAHKLDRSPNYTLNKTYSLFAMLEVNGTKSELLKNIVRNYSKTFQNSDIYKSQILIIGIGVLLIERGFQPQAIFNYLMSLLGVDFLVENLRYTGVDSKKLEGTLDLSSEIKYKPFEGNLRKTKYDLLALLKMKHQNGLGYIENIINNHYGDQKLMFYFNLFNCDSPDMVEYLYEKLRDHDNRADKLYINACYAFIHNLDVFATHYLFNSVIGKYSRYDKDSTEIEHETDARYEEIMALIK